MQKIKVIKATQTVVEAIEQTKSEPLRVDKIREAWLRAVQVEQEARRMADMQTFFGRPQVVQ